VYDDDDDVSYNLFCPHVLRKTHKSSQYGISNEHKNSNLLKGCMGLYDGADGTNEVGSTAEIAKWVGAPVVLVVDAWCLSRSAAAMVHGYASFDADIVLAGVVFNKIGGDSHSQWYIYIYKYIYLH
jgi:cobyrinic acid a,c-diamide synthase